MTVQKYTLITVNAPLDPECAHIWTLGLAQFVNNCLGGGLKSQAGCDLLVQFSNCESGFQNNGPLLSNTRLIENLFSLFARNDIFTICS